MDHGNPFSISDPDTGRGSQSKQTAGKFVYNLACFQNTVSLTDKRFRFIS